MINDEISAAISESLEPFASLPEAPSADSKELQSVGLAWAHAVEIGKTSARKWIPIDWLEGENSMRLLEVMPRPCLWRIDGGDWMCEATDDVTHVESSKSRQEAVRNAYCAWKEIPFKGPDPDTHLGHEGSE